MRVHLSRDSVSTGDDVDGGRATWALSSNIPLAVTGAEPRLHWSYFAQRDPELVLEVLRELGLRAVGA